MVSMRVIKLFSIDEVTSSPGLDLMIDVPFGASVDPAEYNMLESIRAVIYLLNLFEGINCLIKNLSTMIFLTTLHSLL